MPVVAHVELSPSGDLALMDGEITRLTQSDVTQYSPFSDTQTSGVLVITNMRVVWFNKDTSSNGSSYNFRDISMHAIASGSESFDKPCLYCHLDTEDVTEVRFVPEDSTSLQRIYEAFCQGAMDNPDTDEEEPTDAWISSAMEDDRIEGQFDDA